MINRIRCGLAQENIAIFLFSIVFWFSLISNKWTNSVFILMIIFGIIVMICRWGEVYSYLKKSRFIYLFLLLWVPLILSTFDSAVLNNSIRYDLNMLRFLFVGALAILLSLSGVRKIFYVLLTFILVVSFDAIVEWSTGYHLLGESRDRVRIMGLFSYYHLGYYLATILPILLYQILISFQEKSKYRYCWMVALLAASVVIFIAGSRAGWITFFVGFIILFVWLIWHRKIPLKVLSIAICLIVILAGLLSQLPIVKNRYNNAVYTNQTELWSYEWFDKFSSARLVLWEFAWKEYMENPIVGAGVNTYRVTFNSQSEELKRQHAGSAVIQFPHLNMLEVLSDTGTIGFIAYTIVLLWLISMIFTAKIFPAWLIVSFLALMPINTHMSLYGSGWAVLIWIPLILGLRERYLLMQKDPVNA